MKLTTVLCIPIIAMLFTGCINTTLQVKDSKLNEAKETVNDEAIVDWYAGRPVTGHVRVIAVVEDTRENYGKLTSIVGNTGLDLERKYPKIKKIVKTDTMNLSPRDSIALQSCINGQIKAQKDIYGTYDYFKISKSCENKYARRTTTYKGEKEIYFERAMDMYGFYDEHLPYKFTVSTVKNGNLCTDLYRVKVKHIDDKIMVYFYNVSPNYIHGCDTQSFMEINNILVEKINASGVKKIKDDTVSVNWQDL